MHSIKAVYRYAEEDKDFMGDYCAVDLYVDEKLVHEYGDHYHEHASDKIKGFLQGLDFAGVKYVFEETGIADYKI